MLESEFLIKMIKIGICQVARIKKIIKKYAKIKSIKSDEIAAINDS